MDYLQRINETAVTFEDLWKIAGEAEDIGNDGGGFEDLMRLITKHFHGQPSKASAVLFRMQALASLLESKGAPGWALPPQKDGAIATQEWVFAAAAVQPLVIIDEQPSFEHEAFLNKVLELAETEGQG